MGALYVIVLNGVGEDLFFRYQEGERAKSALLFENSSKFVTNLRINKIFVDNGSYFRLDQSLFVVITTKIARKQRNTDRVPKVGVMGRFEKEAAIA